MDAEKKDIVFKDKVIVITGASSGIGGATAKYIAERGGVVYNIDKCKPEKAYSRYANFVKCNLAEYRNILSTINSEILKQTDIIDCLFANAATHVYGNILDTATEQIDEIINVNIKSVIYLLKSILPVMIKRNQGCILLMGSDQCIIGKKDSSLYGLSKGAICQLTKSTAIDFAKFNIRVNCICPGTVYTNLFEKFLVSHQKKTNINRDNLITQIENAQPIKYIASPSDIAKISSFLLSDLSSYMTGSIVSVDGGYTCQ